MTKLKGLLLTEGMHGMISQVEGLAKALDLDFIHERIELNNFWKLFPPKLTPVQDFVFKNKINNEFDIVISCGRKSVIPSIYLKKKFKSKIINIHIQEPRVSLNNFDFVVVPEHDGLKGSNVFTSKGAVHYLTHDELDENENYLKSRISTEKKIVTLVLGGPTRYYDYNNQVIEGIFSKI
ncbi:ELM1/GtrOC1 family putative glycosyltransferase, partial [Candidatus Pelagibacter sp.]|nr:ELM1/GtrOC1 family putative glycosyltransferase [Candidatus Pelagibacter sp.]